MLGLCCSHCMSSSWYLYEDIFIRCLSFHYMPLKLAVLSHQYYFPQNHMCKKKKSELNKIKEPFHNANKAYEAGSVLQSTDSVGVFEKL